MYDPIRHCRIIIGMEAANAPGWIAVAQIGWPEVSVRPSGHVLRRTTLTRCKRAINEQKTIILVLGEIPVRRRIEHSLEHRLRLLEFLQRNFFFSFSLLVLRDVSERDADQRARATFLHMQTIQMSVETGTVAAPEHQFATLFFAGLQRTQEILMP